METFREAIIDQPGNIFLRQAQKREPGKKEALIKIKSSAICGSDMHLYSGRHPYVKLPTTVGHEVAAVVEAVGSQVTKIKVGDRVCVEPFITCGECYYCKRGRYDYCENLKLKYRTGNSGYADYYYAEEQWIHHLPDEMSFDEGALMEPLACTVHAAMKAQIKLCDSVCVMGDGPIALLLAQLSRVCGATHVYVLGLVERNLKLAESFGCIPLRSGPEAVEEVLRRTEGRGVDVCFEAVGLPVTFNQTMAVTKKGGRAVIFGIFEDEFSTKALVDAMVKELEVVGTSSYCWDFQRGIDLVSTGRIDVKSLVTHHFPLEDVKKAMDIKKTPGEDPLKIILNP